MYLWRFFGVERVVVNCCGVDDIIMLVEMVIILDNREELCNLYGLNDEVLCFKVRKIWKIFISVNFECYLIKNFIILE